MTPEDRRLHALDADNEPRPERAAHDALEGALFEIKRVIVGQEAMLERVVGQARGPRVLAFVLQRSQAALLGCHANLLRSLSH